MVYAYYVERTPGVHAASDGSGLLARRVLKHCPMLAPVLVADPRSDGSRIQCPLSNVQSSFSSTTGKGSHDITNPRVASLLGAAVSAVSTYSNNTKGIQ